jgi:hypothetical protein
MSSIQDVSAEQLAKLFQHYREALAQDYDCNANEEKNAGWDRTSNNEKRLMVAAARLALLELAATTVPDQASRKYFSKPGEADWGC